QYSTAWEFIAFLLEAVYWLASMWSEQGYIQDLKNYDEYIKTTVLNQEQLAEALRLYKQTLVAYDEVLR
ncbi:hypothetical protein, partial [Pseudomonas aeruginosa]